MSVEIELLSLKFGCTGSWGILALGEGQLGEVPVGGNASWGKCQLRDFNLSDFLGTIFILIHFFIMDATNEHFFKIKFIQLITNYKVDPSFLLYN